MTDQLPDATKMVLTDADRLALALCIGDEDGCNPCESPCKRCRRESASHCCELAQILRERHGGSSSTADWLDEVGSHA
jgi:hypothetical protein